jgi:hypothetical protein
MPERNWGCRISLDHAYKGYRLAVLENDELRVSVLLDKGADIVEFQHKPSGTDFSWWTPWGLHPRGTTLPSSALKEGFFGDYYEGGWQEIFPSGGVPNTHQGTEFGLHGEASLQPWEARIVDDSVRGVCLEATVTTYRTPFRLTRRMSLVRGSAALRIETRAENLSPVAVDAQWGQHPALGAPFLNEHCRVDLPKARCVLHPGEPGPDSRFEKGAAGEWPKLRGKGGRSVDLSRFPGPGERSSDLLYLSGMKQGWYGVTDVKRRVGFALAWDIKLWPYLWYWQVYHGARKAPFWGRTYNAALEPFSGWPSGLANAAANGTALRFAPGEVKRGWITAVGHSGRARVAGVGRDGSVR